MNVGLRVWNVRFSIKKRRAFKVVGFRFSAKEGSHGYLE